AVIRHLCVPNVGVAAGLSMAMKTISAAGGVVGRLCTRKAQRNGPIGYPFNIPTAPLAPACNEPSGCAGMIHAPPCKYKRSRLHIRIARDCPVLYMGDHEKTLKSEFFALYRTSPMLARRNTARYCGGILTNGRHRN